MEKIGRIAIWLFAALFLTSLAVTGASALLSNSGGGTWKYQRDISIKENSGTALTDYQVLVELKGADFPNEAQSSGADIRFTDSSGNELNYWIEGWDYAGKNAKIWLKVPSISPGAITIIRMYYGNPSASSASNGDKTFEFFDDFMGTSLDTNKWTFETKNSLGNPSTQGSYNVANGEMYLRVIGQPATIDYAKIDTVQTFTAPYIIEGRFAWYSDTLDAKRRGGHKVAWIKDATNNLEHNNGNPNNYKGDNIAGSYNYYDIRYGETVCPQQCFYTPDGSQLFNVGDFIASTKTYHKGLYQWASGNLKVGIDNVIKGTSAQTFSLGATKIAFQANNWDTGGDLRLYIDYVSVRKYASPEPTIALAPPKSSSLSVTKSAYPYSIRQFQETAIKVSIENTGSTDVKAIEVMDSIHPSFDLISGDFPNPKRYDFIRQGEYREIQYTIKAKESGTFTLNSATVTYADRDGNIQEIKSEPVSIKVVSSPPITTPTVSSTFRTCGPNASVNIHGERTDVVLGEDILLKLSAVNLIIKPVMHVQVIIIPPSGMSVTSSEFVESGAGQYTTAYELEPSKGRDIEVRIRSNEVGDFVVNGRVIYYFDNEKDKAEDCILNLPITVKEIATPPPPEPPIIPSTLKIPGFIMIVGIFGLLIVVLIRRYKL